MANKFVSFLKKIGSAFKKGLDPTLKIAETAGEVAVSIFAPGMSALFNQTVSAVITAEQNAAALGKQDGSGPQKLAAVVQIMGGLIKQSLTDVGKEASDAEVEKYISAVVTILNATPADAFDALTSSAPVIESPTAAAAGATTSNTASVTGAPATPAAPQAQAPIQSVLP